MELGDNLQGKLSSQIKYIKRLFYVKKRHKKVRKAVFFKLENIPTLIKKLVILSFKNLNSYILFYYKKIKKRFKIIKRLKILINKCINEISRRMNIKIDK